jgi:hypothetical protein
VPLNAAARIQRVPSALWTTAGTEVVVVSGLGEMFLALDGVGTDIWRQIEAPVAVGELVTDLRRRYQVDEERCLADVRSYLEMLLSHRVVTVVA